MKIDTEELYIFISKYFFEYANFGMSKTTISFRIFDDRKIRAAGVDHHQNWGLGMKYNFNMLRRKDNNSKASNYPKYLKTKLKKKNSRWLVLLSG